jgi:hypothetical protein
MLSIFHAAPAFVGDSDYYHHQQQQQQRGLGSSTLLFRLNVYSYNYQLKNCSLQPQIL